MIKTELKDLKESNEFLNLLLDNMNSAILIADENLQILLRADGTTEYLDQRGPAIGTSINIPFSSEEKVLRKNDKLLFFTDGIYECCNPAGDFFGKDRFYAAVEKNRELPIQKLVNAVFATAQNFCQSAKPDDDMSLLGIEYTGDKSAEYIN